MRFFFVFFTFLASGLASAYETGGQVLAACEANPSKGVEQLAASIHCSGYVTGFIDGLLTEQATLPVEKQFLCIREVSGQETQTAVVKWLKSHPESTNDSARIAVLKALQASYPCQR